MPIDFALDDAQRQLIDTVRRFIASEIYPHEEAVDRAGTVPPDLGRQIAERAIAHGLFAANMPEAVGGGGLDAVTLALFDREFGKASWSLAGYVGRPLQILLACQGEQIERYLLPTVRGERKDCFALTEPGAGSDAMAITTRATRDGDDYLLNGTKHFISGVGVPDFAIVFAVTGEDDTPRGARKRITAFLVDRDMPGFALRRGPHTVSYRAYNNYELTFTDCRVPAAQILGTEGQGFALANEWLAGSRLLVAATCCGKAERLLEMSTEWAAQRRQFGQAIGRFQGVGFKLADMATELRAADLITLNTAWRLEQRQMTNGDAAMAKLYASEMLGRVADHAVQIFGGMGLVDVLPIERMWRDARIERIWEGTSEIQRHIIARELLRPHEREGN
jgi:acyl-CoA dehydrogenase